MASYCGIQEPVAAAVWYCLNNYLYDDAIFVAEKLHAEVGSMETTFLLGTCYYRSGRLQQAKFLLGNEKIPEHPQCALLYARCCLDLGDFNDGILALNGSLTITDSTESKLQTTFGQDMGVAFLLLGKLKLCHQQLDDAATCFRSALKHNPFLWSAFSELCELEKDLSSDECFKVSEYPTFLRPHPLVVGGVAPPTSSSSLQPFMNTNQSVRTATKGSDHRHTPCEVAEDDEICAESAVGGIGGGGVGSAFKPIAAGKPIKPVLETPCNLYEPMGSAIASSTPARQDHGRGTGPHAHFGGGAAGPRKGLDSVAMNLALHYSSDRPKGVGMDTPSLDVVGTQLNPSFGVLSLGGAPAGGSGETPFLKGVEQYLSFSSVTPSPSPSSSSVMLPPQQYYSKLLLSASAAKQALRPSPLATSASVRPEGDTPSTTTTMIVGSLRGIPRPHHPQPTSAVGAGETPHPLARSTTLHEQVQRSTKREAASPPPVGQGRGVATASATGGGGKGASVARLRRSVRIKGSTSKRLSEHAIHSTRAKSRLKSPRSPTSPRRNVEASGKKGVTFGSSMKTRSSGPSATPSIKRSQSTSNTPGGMSSLGGVSTVLTANQNTVNLQQQQQAQGGGREGGVVMEEEEMKKEKLLEGEVVDGKGFLATQQLLEQAAMSGLTSLMQLMAHIGRAYHALRYYDLGNAVRTFLSLPPHHRDTPWVLSQLAMAYFAAERFDKAAELFKRVHKMDPHRQEGMEYYSSCLWHLQKDVALSILAHQLNSSKHLSPQALCAKSSLKNLHKEHEAAIGYLSQAVQRYPEFAYAHTLLGYEYWLGKDYDKAIASFQHATAIDPRHYNAWYGMAHISFAQEKYVLAERYAARALAINRCSSISCTQVGLAQFRQGKLEKALETFERALVINPFNPIPRFHKAKALEARGSLEEALVELDILVKRWPKEPSVYMSKGKILKLLNRTHEASLQFSWALTFGRSSAPNSQLREEIDHAYHNQNDSDLHRENEEADFLIPDEEDLERDDYEGVAGGRGGGDEEGDASMSF